MTEQSGHIKPISLTNVRIKKCLLSEVKTLAGFDRGCSLCKLLYRSKTASDENSEFYEFTCALFYNADFIASLDWMKAEAQLPQMGTLYVTGTGGHSFSGVIKEKIGLDIVVVDEYVAQPKGAYFLIKNMEPEEILHKAPEINDIQIGDKSVFKNIREGNIQEMRNNRASNNWPPIDPTDNRPVFPVLYSFLGSGGVNMIIGDNDSQNIAGYVSICGKTFLGLARCLLNTCDYSEIIKLAEAGTKRNVDTVLSDVMPEDYLRLKEFPPDLALFHLGKIVDNDMDISTVNRADLARSLISMVAHSYLVAIMPTCVSYGIPQVYIGGNLMQSAIFREELKQHRGLWGQDTIHVKYLKSGHTGAIGAMLHQPNMDES